MCNGELSENGVATANPDYQTFQNGSQKHKHSHDNRRCRYRNCEKFRLAAERSQDKPARADQQPVGDKDEGDTGATDACVITIHLSALQDRFFVYYHITHKTNLIRAKPETL